MYGLPDRPGTRPPRWEPDFRPIRATPTGAAVVYDGIRALHPDAALGYGIDRRGAWARVGDHRARGPSPESALRLALAEHLKDIA